MSRSHPSQTLPARFYSGLASGVTARYDPRGLKQDVTAGHPAGVNAEESAALEVRSSPYMGIARR